MDFVEESTASLRILWKNVLLPYGFCGRMYCFLMDFVEESTASLRILWKNVLLPYGFCGRMYCFLMDFVEECTASLWILWKKVASLWILWKNVLLPYGFCGRMYCFLMDFVGRRCCFLTDFVEEYCFLMDFVEECTASLWNLWKNVLLPYGFFGRTYCFRIHSSTMMMDSVISSIFVSTSQTIPVYIQHCDCHEHSKPHLSVFYFHDPNENSYFNSKMTSC